MAGSINDAGKGAGISEARSGAELNPHAFVYDIATKRMTDLRVHNSQANHR